MNSTETAIAETAKLLKQELCLRYRKSLVARVQLLQLKRKWNARQLGPIGAIFDIAMKTLPTYHDEAFLKKALDCIDLEKVYGAVEMKEEQQKDSIEENRPKDKHGRQLGYTDFLVKQLLQWYKEEFFKWVNQPECEKCHTASHVALQGRSQPTQDERVAGGASVVEIYRCGQCSSTIRFPRYNNLSRLLDWRQGRCGEWNNCFILLLNALNVETRYLWNAEDHVWCEYWSVALQRWIHLDCCENAFDQPLLYNEGWNKKMSYVFAIGDDYIRDVSSKYIVKNKLPRKFISERDLARYIKLYNYTKWAKLTDDALYKVICKYSLETKDLSGVPCMTKTQDLRPRQSGSTEWTATRGEAGN